MTRSQTQTPLIPEAQRGPAEKLLDLVLGSSAHLWHNRPGVDERGVWRAATRADRAARRALLKPGLFLPAALRLYRGLLEIYKLNAELMAHFASYAIVSTEWRDLKVCCAALMLVQPLAGQPVKNEEGQVEFCEDDYRAIGEAMLLHYERKSTRSMTPKGVLRVAELLETDEIAALNRQAGFADPASRKPPLGRWPQAATRWLQLRERNLPMLEGLVAAGYKETIKKIARKAGYKPELPVFFEVLGWKQKQSATGHRTVGLGALKLHKRERFDGLSEAEICERIVEGRLGYKEVTGRLPKDIGLTPAIMMTCLPSLSDRDLRQLTPTLEELGLLQVPEARARWERAVETATDQRALNVAKRVRDRSVREKLEEASDQAARHAVAQAVGEQPIEVMFLVDKSGSMEGAIEKSKEALARILAGFPMERLHVASFDTMGTVLKPKAPTRAAVQHCLAKLTASGGTTHGAAVRALHAGGLRVGQGVRLLVIVAGDEAGEDGAQLAQVFRDCGYAPAGLALIVNVSGHFSRGTTVRGCAAALQAPFAEVGVEQFEDPYQVPRVLQTLLEAPPPAADWAGPPRASWVDKVMQTPLLQTPA